MIEAIIFDFGDVFVDLDKQGCYSAFEQLGSSIRTPEFEALNHRMEIGAIAEADFLAGIGRFLPGASIADIRSAWNTIIGELPRHRMEFLKTLSKNYRLFLLTNTDSIHMKHFREKNPPGFADEFFGCFEKVYYSFELGCRKPDPEAYLRIIAGQGLNPELTLFVDDRRDNCEGAAAVGLKVWHLRQGEQDVTEMFNLGIL